MGLGPELITDEQNRAFTADTTEGEWLLQAGGAGSYAYNTEAIGGDNSQLKLTSGAGDSNLYTYLPIPTNCSIPAYSEVRIQVDLYIPSGNTLKDVMVILGSVAGETGGYKETIPAEDTYVTIISDIKLASDVTGQVSIGLDGNPSVGDIIYIDNISVKQLFKPSRGNLGSALMLR